MISSHFFRYKILPVEEVASVRIKVFNRSEISINLVRNFLFLCISNVKYFYIYCIYLRADSNNL